KDATKLIKRGCPRDPVAAEAWITANIKSEHRPTKLGERRSQTDQRRTPAAADPCSARLEEKPVRPRSARPPVNSFQRALVRVHFRGRESAGLRQGARHEAYWRLAENSLPQPRPRNNAGDAIP